MIRTLVCASSELARAGLASVVRSDARLVLAGEAIPPELERQIVALDPDVVLELRDGPAEAVRASTVALVDDPRGTWANDGRTGGEPVPHAILARDAPAPEIAAAIVAVAAGLVAVAPRTLAARSTRSELGFEPERLTAREIEVLSELARGVANKTIAARLNISEHTVKFHIGSIFAKLGVASRTEAVAQGVRLGLVML